MKLGDLGGLQPCLLPLLLSVERQGAHPGARAKKPARQSQFYFSGVGGALLPCGTNCDYTVEVLLILPLHALVHRLTVLVSPATLAWNTWLCFPTLG